MVFPSASFRRFLLLLKSLPRRKVFPGASHCQRRKAKPSMGESQRSVSYLEKTHEIDLKPQIFQAQFAFTSLRPAGTQRRPRTSCSTASCARTRPKGGRRRRTRGTAGQGGGTQGGSSPSRSRGGQEIRWRTGGRGGNIF